MRTKPAFLAVILAVALLALAPAAKAVLLPTATGTLTETATGASFNTFTITLQNTSVSASIETFWFAWVPGKDFLDTTPLTVTPPSGWTDTITHGGASDGYAIEFSTSTAPLAAGGSLPGFNFTSADSLAQMSSNSNFYPTTATTTSEVTTAPNDTGTSSNPFVVTVATVPEPGVMALLAASGGVVCLLRRRPRRP